MSEQPIDTTPDPAVDDPTDDSPILASPYDDNGMHTDTDPTTGTKQDDDAPAEDEA